MLQIEIGSTADDDRDLVKELAPQVRPMVVDKVDGRELSGYVPFYLVVKPRGKPTKTISEVERILLK